MLGRVNRLQSQPRYLSARPLDLHALDDLKTARITQASIASQLATSHRAPPPKALTLKRPLRTRSGADRSPVSRRFLFQHRAPRSNASITPIKRNLQLPMPQSVAKRRSTPQGTAEYHQRLLSSSRTPQASICFTDHFCNIHVSRSIYCWLHRYLWEAAALRVWCALLWTMPSTSGIGRHSP